MAIPGINGSSLRPSISPGNWRTSAKGKKVRSSQVRQAISTNGAGSLDLAPVNPNRRTKKIKPHKFSAPTRQPRKQPAWYKQALEEAK